MTPPSPDRLRTAPSSVATWLSIGSPVIAELAADSGFDWLLFDLEHGCITDSALLGNLQAVRGSPSLPIVRVGAPYDDLMLRVLDWGAAGIMVPHVESAETAAACIRAMRYAPHGHRGYSRSCRAYGYGTRPVDDASLPKPLFIAQIETLKGLNRTAEIAAVDGVDMLFIGPADLGFDLRANRHENTRTYIECLQDFQAMAKAAGKPTGILVRNIDEVDMLRGLGFQHLAIDSDIGILRSRYQFLRQRFDSPRAD